MPLLTSILVLLVTARLLGELMNRMKQPAIIGEMMAGVILGPAIFNVIEPTPHLAGIAELSVFLIVLSAGLEMEFFEVLKAFRGKGLIIAFLGFVIPLVSGTLLGLAFYRNPTVSFFLGLCMAITALPVAVRILENFRMLKTEIGGYAIATAVMNDVAALLFLGILLDRPVDGTLAQVGLSTVKTAGKLLGMGVLIYITSYLLRWGGTRTQYIERLIRKLMVLFGKEALFSIAILFVLVFGSLSETLGSHSVIGTFFGGLLLSSDVFGKRLFTDLDHTIHSIGAGFLSPIFFAFLGLHFSPDAFNRPFLVAGVLLVAMFSKYFAGYWGAKLTGMKKADGIALGIILNGRGIMELVVANIAFQRGFIQAELFSILVLMGIVTTLVTPIFLKRYQPATAPAYEPPPPPLTPED